MKSKEKIEESVEYILQNKIKKCDLGIVIGTGLGGLVNTVNIIAEIPYSSIPHFPVSKMEMQNSRIIFGKINSREILIFDGRFHKYEDLNYFQITYPIYIMSRLGVRKLIVTNAAGGIDLKLKKGQLMIIKDHINLQGGSPLAEKENFGMGERFVDMSRPYSKDLIEKVVNISNQSKIKIDLGVYACVVGPQLETSAEYKYLRIIGADAVGMSTVPEIIVANQLGIECLAISVITDLCDPENLEPINIKEIIEMGKKGEKQLLKILIELLKDF